MILVHYLQVFISSEQICCSNDKVYMKYNLWITAVCHKQWLAHVSQWLMWKPDTKKTAVSLNSLYKTEDIITLKMFIQSVKHTMCTNYTQLKSGFLANTWNFTHKSFEQFYSILSDFFVWILSHLQVAQWFSHSTVKQHDIKVIYLRTVCEIHLQSCKAHKAFMTFHEFSIFGLK